MTTRSMIAINAYGGVGFELFYRHCDGYPTALGYELTQFLHQINAELRMGILKDFCPEVFMQRLTSAVNAKEEGRTVADPKDAFLKVQGDLEYIYAITLGHPSFGRTRLDIYRTSNPRTKVDFVFHIGGFYLDFAPSTIETIAHYMTTIEHVSHIALNAIQAFEEVNGDNQ